MGAYINKAELLKELSVIQDRPVHSAMQIIKILPTIDLVRCEECKHRVLDQDIQSGHMCLKRRSNGGLYCEDDDFCSYGKRRE